MGLRYWVDRRPVPGIPCRADLVFPGARLAVFVDGCFWHGCPEHYKPPSTNAGYWSAKVTRNVDRDRRVDVALREAGWRVLRVWEHEETSAAAARVAELVRLRSSTTTRRGRA
jgi:DNA mismatch endonuclease (patch repair protein)